MSSFVAEKDADTLLLTIAAACLPLLLLVLLLPGPMPNSSGVRVRGRRLCYRRAGMVLRRPKAPPPCRHSPNQSCCS